MNAPLSPSPTRLEIRRHYKCTPELLFDCFVKEEHMKAWWGPESTYIPEITLDVTPGGAWRTVMKNKEGKTSLFKADIKR